MKISVLGSGSTGNAVLLVANGTRVLVDAGLSAREVARRMALLGEEPNSLDGILITHEHGDHAGGLRVLMKDLDCPVFISAKTRDAYVCERRNVANDEPRRRADALRDRAVEIDSGRDFQIGQIEFHPFTIPHDAVDNFGFTATHDGVKIATLMDFGHITTLITERLRGCAAIERGPLVYCLEQVDQDSDIDEVALLPGTRLRPVHHEDLPGVGRTVTGGGV